MLTEIRTSLRMNRYNRTKTTDKIRKFEVKDIRQFNVISIVAWYVSASERSARV